MEKLYEDFLEILSKDSKLPLEQIEQEAALLAREEFDKQQKGEKNMKKIDREFFNYQKLCYEKLEALLDS